MADIEWNFLWYFSVHYPDRMGINQSKNLHAISEFDKVTASHYTGLYNTLFVRQITPSLSIFLLFLIHQYEWNIIIKMQSQILNFRILTYLTKCTFQKTLKKGTMFVLVVANSWLRFQWRLNLLDNRMVKREYTKLSVYGWQRLLFNFKESTSQYRALVGFYMYIVSFYVFCF